MVRQTARLTKTKQPIPEIGVSWTPGLLLGCAIISLALTAVVIGGYFFYRESRRSSASLFSLPVPKIQNQARLYTNDYWGFRFTYPSSWWPVTGSFTEGDYYFSSQPINFASELSNNQALLEVKSYNNLQNLNFQDWLSNQEQNYFPYGVVLNKQPMRVGQYQAERYLIQLKKPQNSTGFWDMVIISKDDKKMYYFTLQTSTKTVHDQFVDVFNNILQQINFYQGFGT